MAGRVENLGGIGISIVADATQVQSTFKEAIKSFSAEKVKIIVHAEKDDSFDKIREDLRDLNVTITLHLNPTRETARYLKRGLQERLAAEGGILVPVKLKAWTKAEASDVRDDIVTSLGTVEIPVYGKWAGWAEGGGPPGGWTMGVRGNGPRGNGPPNGAQGRGPARDADVEWVEAEPGPARQPTRRPANGPGLGLVGPEQGPQEEAIPGQEAAPEEKRKRQPRLNPRKWRQRAGETPEEFTARLEEVRLASLEKLANTQSERVAAKAYNDISRVNLALKTPGHTGILPVPRKGEENRYPQRVDTEGNVVRGGPEIGPLLSDVAADVKKAGASKPGDTAGRDLRRTGPPLEEMLGTHLRGANLASALGIKLDEYGNVTDLGEVAGASGLTASKVEKYLRDIFPQGQTTGVRGAQRTQRSFLDVRRPGERGARFTPEDIEKRREENRGMVAGGGLSEQFMQEMQQGLVRNYSKDKAALRKFAKKFAKNQGDILGEEFAAAIEALETEGPVGQPSKKFLETIASLGIGQEGVAQRHGPNAALEVALKARANLLAAGRAGQITGVGPATVRRATDPTMDRPERNPTPSQFKFLMQADALGAVIGEAFRQITEAGQNLEATARGKAGAETRAAYPKAPTRQIIPMSALTQAPTESDADFATRQTAAKAERRRQQAAEDERFTAAQARYENMAGKAQTTEAERLSNAAKAQSSAAKPEEGPQPETVESIQAEPPIQPGSVFDGGDYGDGGDGGGDGYFFGGQGGGPIQVEVINWPEGFGSNMARAAEPAEPVGNRNLNEFLGLYGPELQKLAQDRLAASKEPAKEKQKAKTPEELAAAEKAPSGKTGLTLAAALRRGQRLNIGADENELAQILGQGQGEVNANLPLTAREQKRQDALAAAQYARQAVELSPARAVATAAGQVAANLPFLGGRSGILRRSREAVHATSDETAAYEKLKDAEAAVRELERQRDEIGQVHNQTLSAEEKHLKTLTPAYKETEDAISKTKDSVALLGEEYDKAADNSIKLNKGVATATDIVRSFGAGVLGTITGQILFQGALGATQAALELGSKALGPYLERITGYHEATNQITNSLSDNTRAANGWVNVVVSQAAAQARLNEQTYASIAPALEQRAAVEAGNKAYQDQIKLIAASRNVSAGQRGGLDKGLFETTGGLSILGIDTPIGGTPSTGELIGQQLQDAFSQVENAPLEASKSFWSELLTQTPGQTFNGGFEKAVQESADAWGRASANFTGTLDGLNRDFAGTGVTFVRANDAMAASTEDAAQALDDAGFDDIASQIRRDIISLSQQSVDLGTPGLQGAVAKFNQRQQRPDVDVLIQQLREQVIPALTYGIEQNLQNQLQTFIPAQRGLRYAAQPVAPFGRNLLPMQYQGAAGGAGGQGGFFREGGYSPLPQAGAAGGFANGQGFFRQAQTGGVSGFGGQFGGVPQSVIDTFRQYRDEASTAIDAINAKAAEGERVLENMPHVSKASLAELKELGERISDINQQQANIRLDLQYSQFNRQLYLANRQISDLAGLTDRAGSSQIGMLERQQQLLGQRGQALSIQSAQLGLQTQQLQLQSGELAQQANILQIERAQRQINFQQAIAGFTAPGITPEERAARIEEAKLEANFSQKQLDFQKQQVQIQQQNLAIAHQQYELQAQSVALSAQQLANSIALQEALNARGYEDAVAAAEELKRAFDAQTQIQALQDLGGLLQEQAALVSEEIGTQVAAEEEFIKAQVQFTQDLIDQTGEFVIGTVHKVQTVFNQAAAAFQQSGLGKFLGFETTVTDAGNTYTKEREGGNAAGFVGRVSGATSMTVGEAGAEEVAILRNPREVLAPVGSGGGGLTIYMPITVTGNNIRNEEDMERLVALLTARVEETLGRHASQFGFRTAR